MKIVFYKTLLTRGRNITPTERIVYSFLVSKSITYFSDLFDSDGSCIDTEELYYTVEEDHWLNLFPINNTRIASELNISRRSVIRCLQSLKDKRYIVDDCIFVNKELLEQGYFELHHTDILTGELLIFYSYIKDKSQKYGGCIDTYKSVLAEQFATTKIAITKLLNRLYELGLVERLENGKLQIN